MGMFCRQCEQTFKGQGCTIKGVCGKDEQVANLQDVLIYGLKSIAVYAEKARRLGIKDKETDIFLINALFTTITNVNFDVERLEPMIEKAYQVKEKIKQEFLKTYKEKHNKDFSEDLPEVADWKPASGLDLLLEQSSSLGMLNDSSKDEDIRSLREMLLYGLKGMAAYADHAFILGESSEKINSFFYKGLASLVDDTLEKKDYINIIMEFGKVNLECMSILDKAHTENFGHPEPTQVKLARLKGPAIIVSGHDLLDMKQLLEQAKDKGINVYTHGEMLPVHAYPALKKYPHLAGHFGSAWQNQQKEFDNVPASILMTTNCIQKPRDSYKDRIFTTGLVAYPGVEHIGSENGKKDFTKVIDKALELKGFNQDAIEKEITIGFARNAVSGALDKVLKLINENKIRHFYLIGGCDGAKPERNYYTEFAERVSGDSIILTLACGKFRINRLDFGDIEGIPRLLDCGQCNDAYSAIQIALALSEKLNCSVSQLPLSIILSWYEQKAVCILLTLLSLGIKNIKLGPSLPAFISSNVLNILVENFNIRPISTVEKDLEKASCS